ncbi:MAG: MarR family transcriptional regulator [Firmicutes bacterium]|nr:MarR family transcriptional regulator [Bacillota bacterium]
MDERELALHFIALQDALGGQYGPLSRPKLRLLVKLTHGPVSVSELAERLHISSPAVSQMIDKLQSEAFVERVALGGDQRVVGVALTPNGQRALEVALGAFQHRIRDLLSVLKESEKTALIQILAKWGR